MTLKAAGYYAHCDSCDAQRMLPAREESRARELLVAFGWHFRNGKDLCRVCATAPAEAAQPQQP